MKISKTLYSFLFLASLLHQTSLVAQSDALFEKINDINIEHGTQQAISIVFHFLDTNTTNIELNKIRAYNAIGRFYEPANLNKVDSSLHYLKLSLGIAEQYQDENAIANNAQDLGILYFRIQNYDKAIPFLKQSIKIYTDNQIDKYAARSISVLSNAYIRKRNYHKALIYQQQSLTLLERNFPKGHSYIADAKHSLAAIQAKLLNYREAINYMQAAYQSYLKEDIDNYSSKIALELGFFYQQFNMPDSALYYAKLVLEQSQKTDYDNLAWIYSIMHEVYYERKEFNPALKYSQLTLDNYLLAFGERDPESAYAYFYIAQSYQLQEKWDSALTCIQKALISNHKTFSDPSLSQNPTLLDVLSVEYQLLFLEKKGEYLHQLYKASKTQEVLKESQHVFETAVEMLDSLRQDYQSPQNLLIQNSINSPVYDKAVSQLFDSYHLNPTPKHIKQSFRYIEQNRALVLNRILLEQQQLSSNEDSSILIQNYQQQKNTIEELEIQINSLKIASDTDTEKISQLQTQLVQAQQQQDQTIEVLKNTQPAYYQQYFQTPTVELAQIQEQLKAQEALIAYSVQEKEVSILKIQKGTVDFYQTTSTDSLSKLVVLFRDAILKKDDAQYLQLGYQLYQQLIEPLQLNKECSQLYILPDKSLNYLPFDALLTQKQTLKQGEFPNYAALPYLLKQVKISYTFSATTWFQQCQLAPSTNTKLVAFAPSFGDAPLALQRSPTSQVNYSLGNLKGSKQEVERIKDFFPSTLKIGEEATKTAFLAHISKAKIIHLATHGLLNEDNGSYSSIAFAPNNTEDNLLYAFELYGLDMNADLVVLSACNTALGKWKAGEGVMSLARGFTSTGCKSILMSLWAVADQSAPTIIPDFYQHLANGEDKSSALQKAKLNYLKEADANGAHPYYWASLTLTGDIVPLSTAAANPFSRNLNFLLLGGLAILLSIILVIKKRAKVA